MSRRKSSPHTTFWEDLGDAAAPIAELKRAGQELFERFGNDTSKVTKYLNAREAARGNRTYSQQLRDDRKEAEAKAGASAKKTSMTLAKTKVGPRAKRRAVTRKIAAAK